MSTKRGKPTPAKHHIKHHIKHHTIPEPAQGTRSVLIMTGTGTLVMRGETAPKVVMDCGSCGARLVQGITASQIQSIVFKCNACGAFNETVEG